MFGSRRVLRSDRLVQGKAKLRDVLVDRSRLGVASHKFYSFVVHQSLNINKYKEQIVSYSLLSAWVQPDSVTPGMSNGSRGKLVNPL